MNPEKFARKLVESSFAERKKLLRENSALANIELAQALQNLCYEIWTNEPQKVSGIVSALILLAEQTGEKEIEAVLEWARGIKNLINGKLEKCLWRLDKSERLFKSAGNNHAAAKTQISKLYALALLGRYEEAVRCGLAAREVFLAEKDIYSAGKIEHNIGNLFWRRDLYTEAEPFLASAFEHFSAINDQRQMAMVENTQAFVKSLQNDFSTAEKIYERAIQRAGKNSLVVTQAEIEIGLSNLYLFQGKPDLALKFMERARCKYEELQMPVQAANCELELADIYLELNLLQEAADLYESAGRKFSSLKMQAERARCAMNFARALLLSGESQRAYHQIIKAETLFRSEGNLIGTASAQIFQAQLLFLGQSFSAAKSLAEKALPVLIEGKSLRHVLFARWLLGEIALAENQSEKAAEIFSQILTEAQENSSSIENLCLIALGKIALRHKNQTQAEEYFRRAVEIIEKIRSTLEAEEFRLAYLSNKLSPYLEIAKIRLARKDFGAAFSWLERSRSRSLLDSLTMPAFVNSNREENYPLLKETEKLRRELNWFYSRLHRNSASRLEAHREANLLKKNIFEREKKLSELERRLPGSCGRQFEFETKTLRKLLGEKILVEYAIFDGQISAFVVDQEKISYLAHIADETVIAEEIRSFLFQIKTGRIVGKLRKTNQNKAFSRFLAHSKRLYDLLIYPLTKFLKTNEIVFVPTGCLHYLPFQALFDGEKFLIESKIVSYAPSASVLVNCLQKTARNYDSALLTAFADETIPKAESEIEKISEILPKSIKIKGRKATLQSVLKHARSVNLLHFACHAKFRPDNPLFSALRLANENLLVRDARKIPLENKLVVLSACETGLNKIETGEEVLGLARGFLSAGVKYLILSFWTVNDESTQDLMVDFYTEICRSRSPAAALQKAQIKGLQKRGHPYFWAPFFLVGG